MIHSTPIKKIVNTILRFLQPRKAEWKFLMYSEFEGDTFIGYGFGWIKHDYTDI